MSLWKVMKTWVECPVTMVKKDKLLYTEEDILDLEHQLATFYTQSFFNTFGHAAIVPHHYK